MALTIRRRGKYWHARGTVPMRQADGKIAWIRIEESTRETTRARAARAAQDIADHYREQAYRPQAPSVSFTDAALTYVKSKNPSKRDRDFVARLVQHFGDKPISEIDQSAVADAAHRLYPRAKAATHQRAVYAPVVTILRLSGVRPDYTRPKVERTPITVPPDEWFDAVLPQCSPRLAALLAFITITGRRISEALEAISNGDGTVTIPRTKAGRPATLDVPACVGDWLGVRDNDWSGTRGAKVWTYGDRHNVYRELWKACERAEVLEYDEEGKVIGGWYGTHAIGRHAFATRLLKAGRSVKHVAAAGGWASPKMVLDRYGHLEQSEVASDVKELGEIWGKQRKRLPKTAEKG